MTMKVNGMKAKYNKIDIDRDYMCSGVRHSIWQDVFYRILIPVRNCGVIFVLNSVCSNLKDKAKK